MKYELRDGVLGHRVVKYGPDGLAARDGTGAIIVEWIPYKGLCQGCRHPGDPHSCGKDGEGPIKCA